MSAILVAVPTGARESCAPEHVAILDDVGRVVAFNDAWQRFAAQHGLRFNVGENYAQACHAAFGGSAERGTALAAGIRAVIDGELPEFAAILPAGEPDETRWLRVRVHRVEGDSPGPIVVTQALVEAVDEEIELPTQLALSCPEEPAYHLEFAAHEKTDSTDISCDSLVQIASRELRTPLNAVIGFSHLLLKEPLGERQLQKVRYVHEAGRTLLELVNNMLEYASLDRGDFELVVQAFDVRHLIQEVVALAQPAANDKRLPVRFVVADDVPAVVQGDRHRLRHVLDNLLKHAVKFTHRGYVLIEVANSGMQECSVRLQFRVSDTGIGMAPNRCEQRFAPCSSSDTEAVRLHEGSGIGLALSRRIIARMGGKLVVLSEPGKGTTFEFDPVFERTSSCDPASTHASKSNSEAPNAGFPGEEASVVPAENEDRPGELEALGQAVIDQNWRTVEHLCSRLIDYSASAHSPMIAEEAFRLTLAARRKSPQRAREVFRSLARAIADLHASDAYES